jgi:vanillate monooxygenase ferredoxin subunit
MTLRNHFPLVHARRSLLSVSSIGITPILCVTEVLTHARTSTCTIARAHLQKNPFRDRINNARLGRHVYFRFDDGDAAQKLDLKLALADPDPETHIYVCGPGGFISYIADAARDRGWCDDQIHFEYFTAAQPDPATARSFKVKIASTGQIIHVSEDTSVTMALSNGVSISRCLANRVFAEPALRESSKVSLIIGTTSQPTLKKQETTSSRPAVGARKTESLCSTYKANNNLN